MTETMVKQRRMRHPLKEFHAALREGVAGTFLSWALSIDAAFVFQVIERAIASRQAGNGGDGSDGRLASNYSGDGGVRS